ncbi:ACP S-malonyltransferase [bacterium]|nr:ACP S-malonyltransferase [bacterium]
MKAFVFPGQGSQKVGMGKDLFEEFVEARRVYYEAKKATGVDWAEISFEADAETLSRTENTQPCLFLHGVALLESLGEKADYSGVAGHSLGEYTALYAAGVLRFEDAFRTVVARGKAMARARAGGMIVPLGVDAETAKTVAESFADEGVLIVANFNAPKQVVISGEERLLDAASSRFVEAGAKRVVRLPVSGAFHSPLMKEAHDEMRAIIDGLEFNEPRVAFYANVSGKRESDPAEIRRLLIEQIVSPVRWLDLVGEMGRDGFDIFVEVGSGKVLRGLVKRILPGTETAGLSDVQSILDY